MQSLKINLYLQQRLFLEFTKKKVKFAVHWITTWVKRRPWCKKKRLHGQMGPDTKEAKAQQMAICFYVRLGSPVDNRPSTN